MSHGHFIMETADTVSPAPDSPAFTGSPEHLRLAIEAARVALWSWNVEDDSFAMDELAFDLWGLKQSPRVAFEELSAHIHPADRDRVRAAFVATRSVAGPYEIDFRIMLGDEIRWVSARGRGADDGIIEGMMFGIFLDVTGRKQAEEGHELLAGEMSHRVKNLLAVAGSLTQLSSRTAHTITDMTKELTQRLSALDRAHDLVRPIPGEQGKAALLGDLITVLLAPYDESAAFSGRIRVAVPRMGVGEKTASTLAMVFHELATNSVKHGALSSTDGMLDVSAKLDDDCLQLVWAETGGPEVVGPPQHRGFGREMIERTVETQLRGKLRYDWQGSGLVATLSIRTSLMTF
ncbi:sensor histidine kinase [Sphingomonas sp. M1-B02]|uniref:sensor histidine kinase n=1 Tax=Sphingomonas sp. M1-B02 TaxID=3114300 RepID=UPI00223FF628|nr:HWE histidine kinase domain-containing protein [Sphingomonas sp. S6-11]UZK66469.1 PAS domain-containing protein [Sphingomonas sp. S6-11]